jgi:hypothetical protein
MKVSYEYASRRMSKNNWQSSAIFDLWWWRISLWAEFLIRHRGECFHHYYSWWWCCDEFRTGFFSHAEHKKFCSLACLVVYCHRNFIFLLKFTTNCHTAHNYCWTKLQLIRLFIIYLLMSTKRIFFLFIMFMPLFELCWFMFVISFPPLKTQQRQWRWGDTFV